MRYEHGQAGVDRPRRRGGSRAAGSFAALAAAAALLVGCDLEVTNPGPVQDSFLDDPGAWNAIYHGTLFNNAFAYTRLAEDGAMLAGEMLAGGLQQGQFLVGYLTSDNRDGAWTNMHRARWVAEDAVRRMEDALGTGFETHALGRQLKLQVGIAHRMLGEHVCHAVMDGGPVQPFTAHFEHAEAAFSDALRMARAAGDRTAELNALAGRATVRIWLGNWEGAVADAGQVPDDHRFQIRYFDHERQGGDSNAIWFSQAGLPWTRLTVFGTFAAEYYPETGDPRVAWETDPAFPLTMVYGHPFYRALKFDDWVSPHNFATGREMRLIEAEHQLRQGNWQGALDRINALRATVISQTTGQPVPAWSAGGVDETWTVLRKERFIELWLDARRWPDWRRWTLENAPGQELFNMQGRSSCYPIGRTEIQTNSNPLPEVT
jgi:starch-binding outer membrane protein, SusD/RagB family